MDIIKRFMAGLLALMIAMGMIFPQDLYAASRNFIQVGEIENNPSRGEPKIQSDISVVGTNSFGNLVANELEKETGQLEESSGYNIFSIEVNGAAASVTYETMGAAMLVVGIYDETGIRMVASGNTIVSENNTKAEVIIEEESIPEYFYLRGFLIDSDTMQPLCAAYESPIYTKEMQEFLKKTTADFKQEKILNLDENTENNFAVYHDEIIVIPRENGVNTVESADDQNQVYVIENADEKITSLQPGDVFSYEYGESGLLIVKVAEISVNGTTATITGAETSMDEVFEYVKIDADAGAKDAVIDDSGLEEGINYEGMIEQEEDPAVSSGEAKEEVKSSDGQEDAKLESSIHGALDVDKSNKTALSFSFVEKQLGKNIKLSGGLDISLESSVKIYISLRYQYLELKPVDFEAKVKVDLSGKIPCKEIRLTRVTISLFPGITIEVTPKFLIEASAKVEFSGKLTGSVGFSISSDEGFKNLSSLPKLEGITVEGEVSVFIGIAMEPKISLISDKIAMAKVEFRIGAEIKGKIVFFEPASQSSIHTCKRCLGGDVNGKAEATFEASLLKLDKLTYKKQWERSLKLFDFYLSFDNMEFGLTTCPHYKFLTEINVMDSSGNAVEGAVIRAPFSVHKENGNQCVLDPEDLEESDFLTTDAAGKAAGYLAAGQYSMEISADGYQTVSKKITIQDHAKRIRVNLEKKPLPASLKVAQFKRGYWANGTVMEDGSLYMWGRGYGNIPVKIMDHARSLSIGADAAAAVTQDGELYMWGSLGYMDYGGPDYGKEPVKLLDHVASVNVGELNAAAITEDGSLYMWGNNDMGGVGNGDMSGADVAKPVKIMDHVVSVDIVGWKCAAVTENGDLYVWGVKTDNFLEHIYKPEKVLSRVTSVGYDDMQNMWAITENGDLYVWGANKYGQLGNGSTSESAVPQKVLGQVVDAAMFYSSMYAVTAEGKLYTWGANISGKLGNGGTASTSVPKKILAHVECAGIEYNTMWAITKEQELFTWGANGYGQLGNGDTKESSVPVKVLDEVVFASMGDNRAGAITEDGSLYMWGTGLKGELGLGTATESATPVKVMGDVESLYLSYDYCNAVTKQGSLYAWGANEDGILGNGTDAGSRIPVQIFTWQDEKSATNFCHESNELFLSAEAVNISAKQTWESNIQQTSDQTIVVSELRPEEIYNLYAMKSQTAAEPFDQQNILYIGQSVTDSAGDLRMAYGLKEEFDEPEIFVVGISKFDLSHGQVSVPDLHYSGKQQSVKPEVLYQGSKLIEGVDYEVAGEYTVTEIGEYNVIIRGIGRYKGEVTVSYRVIGENEPPSGGDAGSNRPPADVPGENQTDATTYEYRLNSDNTTLTITKCISTETDLIIPSSIDGYSVTQVGAHAFENITTMKTVSVPATISQIDTYAFAGCSSLVSVILPDTLEGLGTYAFKGCTSLQSVVLNVGRINIVQGLFSGCISLNNVVVPDSVQYIRENAFEGCVSLQTLRLPKSIKAIYKNAFLKSGIKTISYAGRSADWKNITIAAIGNASILNAAVIGADGKSFSADKTKWNAQQTSDHKVKKPSVPKVKSFRAKSGKKKLTLSWKKVSGAAGYQIQVSTKKGFKGAKTISVSKSKKTFTKKSLKTKKRYYIRIRAYKTYLDKNRKTKKVYGQWISISKKTK